MKIRNLIILICSFILINLGGIDVCKTLGKRVLSDNELKEFSESLLKLDELNENGQVSVNLQNKVYSNSPSINPLLRYVENPQNKQPLTYTLLKRLFREYESGRYVAKTKEEFLNAVMESDVMKEFVRFLNSHDNKMTKEELQDYLDLIWFTSYNRGKQTSSGFKHVFMAEIKNNTVQGLHNWIYFLEQEKLGNLNYIGWAKFRNFVGYPSSIVKVKFTWLGAEKPAGSLFIGTSPELEMALYSICFMHRPKQDCRLSLGQVDVGIRTYSFKLRNTAVIGSAFPLL